MANTNQKMTDCSPEENLPRLVDMICDDALTMVQRSESRYGRLDTPTTLAILLRHALDELASYWPEPPRRDAEMDAALIDLRYQLRVTVRDDVPAVAVVQEAGATIARQADRIDKLVDEVVNLRQQLVMVDVDNAQLIDERSAQTPSAEVAQ